MGAIFSGPPKVKVPDPPPVLPMPDLEDPGILAAAKRKLQVASASGRQSTILSGDSADYSNTKLGTP